MKPGKGFPMIAAMAAMLLVHAAMAFGDEEAHVSHLHDSHYLIQWSSLKPADLYVSAQADADISTMRLVAKQVRNTKLDVHMRELERPYFALRTADGAVYRTAERLLPLQGGSNFRDLGGYPAAGGEHIRWGLLFRSAAMPRLTAGDYDYLSRLNIKTIFDLRSVDERQLLPTEWHVKPAARYVAVDYPGTLLFSRLRGYDGPDRKLVNERLYADFPVLLRRQYKALFAALLARKGPLVIQGGAGQDRTGIAVALILNALGTPRSVIYQDYLLSRRDRNPVNEMPGIDLQKYAATNAEARFLIEYRAYSERSHAAPAGTSATDPLMDSRGRPLLQDAFEQIDADYGSLSAYLERELGVGSRDIANLRAFYLE